MTLATRQTWIVHVSPGSQRGSFTFKSWRSPAIAVPAASCCNNLWLLSNVVRYNLSVVIVFPTVVVDAILQRDGDTMALAVLESSFWALRQTRAAQAGARLSSWLSPPHHREETGHMAGAGHVSPFFLSVFRRCPTFGAIPSPRAGVHVRSTSQSLPLPRDAEPPIIPRQLVCLLLRMTRMSMSAECHPKNQQKHGIGQKSGIRVSGRETARSSTF